MALAMEMLRATLDVSAAMFANMLSLMARNRWLALWKWVQQCSAWLIFNILAEHVFLPKSCCVSKSSFQSSL